MDKKWLTVAEAAEYLRCGERAIRTHMANDAIPHTVFAGKALFHVDRLDDWLFSMERGTGETGQVIEAEIPVQADHDHDKVDKLVAELLSDGDGWVARLGTNLQKDLDESGHASLSAKTYAQLSRWCHPKRLTAREKWVKPRVHEISRLLFGRVIDRTQHPSYDH